MPVNRGPSSLPAPAGVAPDSATSDSLCDGQGTYLVCGAAFDPCYTLNGAIFLPSNTLVLEQERNDPVPGPIFFYPAYLLAGFFRGALTHPPPEMPKNTLLMAPPLEELLRQ